MFLGFLAFHLGATAASSGVNVGLDFGDWFERDVLGGLNTNATTLGVFVTAMVFVLLLAWPRPNRSQVDSHVQPTPGETMEPFKKHNPSGSWWALIITLVLFVAIGLFVSLMVLGA